MGKTRWGTNESEADQEKQRGLQRIPMRDDEGYKVGPGEMKIRLKL